MKLIVGLGNPGQTYNFTRHNFGFLALDFYCKLHNYTWEPHPKYNAIYLKTTNFILIKPQSFYNLTGSVVQKYIHYYKVHSQDLLIICDDFALNFGEIRFKNTGSSGGNNGLKSVIEHLSSPNFPRLRLGTNQPELRAKLGDSDFVLSKFTETEKALLPQILQKTAEKITDFLNQ